MIIEQIKQNFYQAQQVLDSFITAQQTWDTIDLAGKLMVEALMTSSGTIPYLMQAKDCMNFMSQEGMDPGSKSVAMAKGSPASIISLAEEVERF